MRPFSFFLEPMSTNTLRALQKKKIKKRGMVCRYTSLKNADCVPAVKDQVQKAMELSLENG